MSKFHFPADTLFNPISSLDHNPALAQALGNLIVTWSDAERSMQAILSLVTGMSAKMAGNAYFAIPTFESRARYLLALAENWPDQRKDDVTQAIEKLRALSGARNSWVHGAYAEERAAPEVIAVFDFRSKDTNRARPLKTNDIDGHCDAVRIRTDRLYELAGYAATPR